MNELKELDKTCPKCSSKLYMYPETMCSDHPELEFWYVECTKCDYRIDETFISSADVLSKIEEIENNK